MKGVILAGGSGTRLAPLTKVTNKHLLPVYDKPLIYYGIEKLVEAGIDRIMVVTSPGAVDDFVNLLGSGEHWTSKNNGKQIQIVYGIQNRPTGIANGLYIAKDYIGDEPCVLYLADNIFEDDISSHIRNFKEGAMIFLKKVVNPERFGVATINTSGNVAHIIEKPEKAESDLAVTGLYIFDGTVFEKMLDQTQSARGEYEITTVNNVYAKEGKLQSVLLEKEWFDAGTFESLLGASNYMQKKKSA